MRLYPNIYAQCASLRAEVSLLSTRLRAAESQKDKYHEQLAAAEKRIDRLQSKTVSAMNPSLHSPDRDVQKDEPEKTPKAGSAEPATTSHQSPSAGVSIFSQQ